MDIEAAREIKTRLRHDVASLLAEPREPSEAATLAIGISSGGYGSYGVAIRHSGEPWLAEPVVSRGYEMAGDECDIRDVGIVRALQWEPAELQARVRPLHPGLSVAHADVTAGTIGAFVLPAGVEEEPVHQILSNNHVLAASDQGALGDVVLQPGPADGGRAENDRVGALTRVVPLDREGPNLVDAATAGIDDGVDVSLGHPAGILTGRREADLDDGVEKVGRTTGLTHGTVSAIEVDGLTVQYPVGIVRFDNQIEVAGDGSGPFSAGGDSGSVVYDPKALEAVGLLFAGSERGGPDGFGLTYCNPIGAVFDRLDIRLPEAAVALDNARAARDELVGRLRDDSRVGGVGLVRWRGQYAVRVNVVSEDELPPLPAYVHGVEVRIVVVGRIHPTRDHGV